jgi:hypothetical protein
MTLFEAPGLTTVGPLNKVSRCASTHAHRSPRRRSLAPPDVVSGCDEKRRPKRKYGDAVTLLIAVSYLQFSTNGPIRAAAVPETRHSLQNSLMIASPRQACVPASCAVMRSDG